MHAKLRHKIPLLLWDVFIYMYNRNSVTYAEGRTYIEGDRTVLSSEYLDLGGSGGRLEETA
jgi:hypothetical protein